MKVGQKLLSVVGALALGMSMTAGAAFAAPEQSSSNMDLSLSVSCLERTDVTVSGNGTFSANLDRATESMPNGVVSTNTNAIQVKVNVGCYNGPWTVNADITDFRNGSHRVPGNKFSLEAGSVSSYYNGGGEVFGIGDPLKPTAHTVAFTGNDADDIFHTSRLATFLGGIPQRAPWTSTALYTGKLNLTGQTLHEGRYTATLTTILVLEDSGHKAGN